MDPRVSRHLHERRIADRENSGCLKFALITFVWLAAGLLPGLLLIPEEVRERGSGVFLAGWAVMTALVCVVVLGPVYAAVLAVVFWPRKRDSEEYRNAAHWMRNHREVYPPKPAPPPPPPPKHPEQHFCDNPK
tara:strand:- start:3632 stop:4030 length:399 start_codon:yes stop_codon:yes gene_type:complete